jgi:SAM-dependent methyltransferase
MTTTSPPTNDALPSLDTRAYHLSELAVARTLGDPRRVMPKVPTGARSVLDVGCGAGQTLIALDVPPDGDLALVGVDIDEPALALGRVLAPHVGLVRAPGEALPFKDGSFDLVLCRVALPYMDAPRAIAEMARVLRPGGSVWLVLHPARFAVAALACHLRHGQLRGALFQLYVLANGLALHHGWRLTRFPFGPRPLESVQTERGVLRALSAAGFERIDVARGRFFVVTAHRPAR